MAEDEIYFTIGRAKGKLLGVISYGSPQWNDDNVTVLAVEEFSSKRAATAWYHRMIIERPWEARQ